MGNVYLRLLPITGVSLFACAMGAFVALTSRSYPQASGAIPASLAFVAVAALGGAVVAVMGYYERRFKELEQRLREAESQMKGNEVGN